METFWTPLTAGIACLLAGILVAYKNWWDVFWGMCLLWGVVILVAGAQRANLGDAFASFELIFAFAFEMGFSMFVGLCIGTYLHSWRMRTKKDTEKNE